MELSGILTGDHFCSRVSGYCALHMGGLVFTNLFPRSRMRDSSEQLEKNDGVSLKSFYKKIFFPF